MKLKAFNRFNGFIARLICLMAGLGLLAVLTGPLTQPVRPASSVDASITTTTVRQAGPAVTDLRIMPVAHATDSAKMVPVPDGSSVSKVAAANGLDWHCAARISGIRHPRSVKAGTLLRVTPECKLNAEATAHKDHKSNKASTHARRSNPDHETTVSPVTGKTAAVWDELAQCESSGNWSTNTGNGFLGGLQFTPSTWHAFGGHGSAHHASRGEQIAVAKRVLQGQGWGAWPACTHKLGYGSAEKTRAMAA